MLAIIDYLAYPGWVRKIRVPDLVGRTGVTNGGVVLPVQPPLTGLNGQTLERNAQEVDPESSLFHVEGRTARRRQQQLDQLLLQASVASHSQKDQFEVVLKTCGNTTRVAYYG